MSGSERDIVAQLRAAAKRWEDDGGNERANLHREAADEIERLRSPSMSALDEAAKYLDAHAAWANDELEKASTETAKALWEITSDEAKRHAKIIRALRTQGEG